MKRSRAGRGRLEARIQLELAEKTNTTRSSRIALYPCIDHAIRIWLVGLGDFGDYAANPSCIIHVVLVIMLLFVRGEVLQGPAREKWNGKPGVDFGP